MISNSTFGNYKITPIAIVDKDNDASKKGPNDSSHVGKNNYVIKLQENDSIFEKSTGRNDQL